jgi:hypothetical protein
MKLTVTGVHCSEYQFPHVNEIAFGMRHRETVGVEIVEPIQYECQERKKVPQRYLMHGDSDAIADRRILDQVEQARRNQNL